MSHCSFADLRKEAVGLLAQLNRLPQREFEKKLHQLFVRDDVSGPLAVMYLLQQLLKISPAENAGFWHSQIEACKEAARVGRRERRFGRECRLSQTRKLLRRQCEERVPTITQGLRRLGEGRLGSQAGGERRPRSSGLDGRRGRSLSRRVGSRGEEHDDDDWSSLSCETRPWSL